MEKKISVIIPQNEDHTYLIRCLNSICRQTCKNIEIVLTGADYPKEVIEKYPAVTRMENAGNTKEEWLSIINKANGDSIYFCSETSVLAPNVLADLLVHAEDGEAYMTAQCVLLEGENLSNCVKAEASIYGKMLKKEILLELLATNEIDGIYALEWAVLEYLNRFQRLECDEQVFVYETNSQVFETHPPVFLEEEAQKKWLEKIKVYSVETRNAFIESWILAAIQEEQIEQLLQQNMEVIAAKEVRAEDTVAVVKNYETELEGPVLAEYVIAKYQQGGLGLKTIWKSFVAWVKYKF